MLVPVPESPCDEHRLVPSDVAGWVAQCAVCGRYWRRARCADGPGRRAADELLAQFSVLHSAVDLVGDPERVEAIAALAETLREIRRAAPYAGRPRWPRRPRR